jgi:cytoskeletal protein CcmA (bactofilin family)
MSETTDIHSSQGSSVALAGAGVQANVATSTGQSVIGPTLVVRGEITAEEDLLIRGRVEGSISHNQTLTVHQEGTIVAAVRAKEIHIEGTVEGDLFGTQRVKICETGQVTGNVVAPRVAVMDGARLKGMVDMDSDSAAIERRFLEQIKQQPGRSAISQSAEAGEKTSGKSSVRRGALKADGKDSKDAAADEVSKDDDQSSPAASK